MVLVAATSSDKLNDNAPVGDVKNSFETIPDVPVAPESDRVIGRQVASGSDVSLNVPRIMASGVATLPAVAGAAAGLSSESSVAIDTGVTSSVPLRCDVYTYSDAGSIQQLPSIAAIPSGGAVFGGRVAYTIDFSPIVSVVTGTIIIVVTFTNYVASPFAALGLKWSVYK